MSAILLQLDQALHGYDNGHRLLAASLQLEPKDERALLSMSDLSGPRAVENFLEYLTGYMLPGGSHYAIAKTWYATEMDRPGCVWTHTILIPRDAIKEIRRLNFLLKRFFRPKLRSGYRYADKLQVSSEELKENHELSAIPELSDDTVLCGIEEIYTSADAMVALLAKNGAQYEDLSLRLWSQLWADVRPEFSFCTGSLSRRSLQGKPLVFQCGPDRVVRDMRGRPFEQCSPSVWVYAVVEDLAHESTLRKFLFECGAGLHSLTDVSRLVRIFLSLQNKSAVSAISLLSPLDYELSKPLIEIVFQSAKRELVPLAFLKVILNDKALDSLSDSPKLISDAVHKSLNATRQKTLDILSAALEHLRVRNRKVVISALAEIADVDLIVLLSDVNSDLYQLVIEQRFDLCYLPSLWSSSLSLLDKIDLFDLARKKGGMDQRRFFSAILESQDADLSSEVVAHLSEKDLSATLEWLIDGDWAIALRPQWISYLRRYQKDVLAWSNRHEPTKSLLLILANVIEFKPGVVLELNKKTVLNLAALSEPLIKDRHEVAAFVYVTTTHIQDQVAAGYCFTAFSVLHPAIAGSHLSNRAWQILEHNLMPLPYEQWDACEKLRRSLLHFVFLQRWPISELWNVMSTKTDLFHDFIRTAKSYEPGKEFFAAVISEGVRGEISISKQQYKEIKKLLR